MTTAILRFVTLRHIPHHLSALACVQHVILGHCHQENTFTALILGHIQQQSLTSSQLLIMQSYRLKYPPPPKCQMIHSCGKSPSSAPKLQDFDGMRSAKRHMNCIEMLL